MIFKSYEDLATCIVNNLYRLPSDIDLILGIPRSGTMVGNILALYCNLPFMDLYSFLSGNDFHIGNTKKRSNIIKTASEARHILLVDDSISSGKAIKEAYALLDRANQQLKITTMAVYGLSVTRHKVDICFEICEQPRFFEWNFMHNWYLEYCCMDIDGVICEDPLRQQNDDAEHYLAFLQNARPKLLPTEKVGKLVSCRLEKYRATTEKWLLEHNVIYGELILLDGISAKQRALSFNHGAFKARIYKDSNCVLFIESDYDQALEVCQLSGKPVFCLEKRQIINSRNVAQKLATRQKEIYITMKRVIKKLMNRINNP